MKYLEAREWAEQILFSNSIEQKLYVPSHLTDNNPGRQIQVPSEPARPIELKFQTAGGSEAQFPRPSELEQTSKRAACLHFFANHELLAIELMALVLLRFPDAPSAFRQGMIQTIFDEQKHFRLYQEQMKKMGVEFGDI